LGLSLFFADTLLLDLQADSTVGVPQQFLRSLMSAPCGMHSE
jgi:hypothetical protein